MKKIIKFLQSKSKYFGLVCLSFLIGVSMASLIGIKISTVGIFGILVIPFGISDQVKQKYALPYFWSTRIIGLLLAVLAGLWRFSAVFPDPDPSQIAWYADKKMTITGVVVAEPDVRIDSVRYIVEAKSIENPAKKVAGRLYVKSERYPQYQYGDELKIICALAKPEPIVDEVTGQTFRYDYYLALQKVFVLCNQPRLSKISSGHGTYMFTGILKAKDTLAKKINELWPEPEASFMAGILYGYRGGLGELNDLFSRTGVTHIVAVSGFNISVIATILITAATYTYIPRQKAFWVVSLGIVGFVIFTGASASVVRAGVMGIITLFAKYVGRNARIGNVMLTAAVLMVWQNPLVLWSDAGFQLSFLSTLGLVYISPLLQKMEQWIPEFLGLRENLISTLSAIIATLPLILYQFGRLSLVAPIVNILILWLISWLMLAGTLAVIVGACIPVIGTWAAWPAHLGMQYIILVVKWFAELPFASVDVRVPAWAAATLYLALLCIIMWHQNRPKLSRF